MKFNSLEVRMVITAAFILFSATVFAQTTSATLTGIVHDPSGAIIPGARVIAIDTRTNLRFETVTTADGTFGFPALQPGNYTLEVETAGFKRFAKTDLILNASDKVSTGILALEVGTLSETVTVTAEKGALQVKTASGEMGEAITGREIQEIGLNGRNILQMLGSIPGIVAGGNDFSQAGPLNLGNYSINGSRSNQHNLTIDGATNVDTGSNGSVHVMMGMDSIAEIKVLTSNYQAEYGRTAGGEIKIVSRGGGSRFHGTGYFFHRHEGLNSNTFFNNADGRKADGSEVNPRALYRYNTPGYNFSGPVPITQGLKARLFFFWGQEWFKQLVPPRTTPYQVRLPTDLEAQGDFSQTLDGNGSKVTVRDPNTGQPFPGNKIPAGRFSPSGQNILKFFNRFVNASQFMPVYNYNSQISSTYPRRQDTIRIDYGVSAKLSLFARYTQDSDRSLWPYGLGQNFALTPTIVAAPGRNASMNITAYLTPTLLNEFIFGSSQNNYTMDPVDGEAATMKGLGLTFAPPYPFSPAQFVNIAFSGTSNQTFGALSGYGVYPYKNSNTTFDFVDNLSKVWGKHILKLGFFAQRSRKDQSAGATMSISFANNAANPKNSGHPYANALLGSFENFSEPQKTIFQGQYRYTNIEWYMQDNFRLSGKLTLDYGMRFYWIQPQYDQRKQAGYFNPSLYDPSKKVRLYYPKLSADGRTTYAVDPANPNTLLPSYLLTRIVPGSGDPFNGIGYAGNGYLRGGIEDQGILFAPRFGFAYDIFGNGKTVLRGGYGLFYDRISGNTIAFPAVGGPPFNVVPTFSWDNLDTVGSQAGTVALGTSTPFACDPGGQIPTTQNFSLQIQRDMGFDTVISIGYVGALSSHLAYRRNINSIPLGTLFAKAAQDPTKFPGGVVPDSDPSIPQIYKDKGYRFDGSKALNPAYLRPYSGYGPLNMLEMMGSSNYHSLQVSMNRRFARNLTYGGSYTWSKSMGTSSGNDGTTVGYPTDIRTYEYRRSDFDRRHILSVRFVWNLPRLSTRLHNNSMIRQIFDNWELSGISVFSSGSPWEISFPSLQPTRSQSITGSPDYLPRLLLTGDPTGRRQRAAWFDPSAFKLPDIGSAGYGPRNYLSSPGLNQQDIMLHKNFRIGGGDSDRRIQIRFEMFNAFNHPSFSAANGGLTWNISADFSDYAARQQYSNQWVRNTRTGVNPATNPKLGQALGEVNNLYSGGARRVIQIAAKFYF